MKKIILVAAFAVSAFMVKGQIPTSNLVGYWPMNGNTQDYSGNNNHGTNYGATLICDRCGNKDMAYHFNGTTNSVVVNNSTSVDMNNGVDFSVSFWMKVWSNPTPDGSPMNKNQYGIWSGYAFMTNNTNPGYCLTPGQASFYTASGAGQDACSNTSICTGNPANDSLCNAGWIHIVGIYDGNTNLNYLYVNSVLQNDVGTISGTLSNAINLVFGAHPAGLAFFKGNLDDIRIYKLKLTQANINALYTEDCVLGGTTGIGSNQLNQNTTTVYPNPTKDVLTVKLENTGATIQLLNCLGQVILSDVAIDKNFSYNLSAQANGVYFLKVIDSNNVQVIKVIKE